MRLSQFLQASGALVAIVAVYGCSLEVNINLDGDDADVSVKRQIEIPFGPDAPAAPDAPVAPEAPVAPDAPAPVVPRIPVPPTVGLPPKADGVIRDALLRQEAMPRVRPRVDPANGPSFTPFTSAPTIRNREMVLRAMREAYPPLLRDAGIGGTVKVFFFIDEAGSVQDVRIDESSGHPALDEAALAVADVYRFAPALNRQEPVPVWVSFPISFAVR